MPDTHARALAAHLHAPVTVAAPDVVGPLAVFPLITADGPSLTYVSFAAGRARGVALKEVGHGAEVNDLVVRNPLEVPVLLYEGEEVVGAQQNRTFDISLLVPAGESLRVPVSCVEAGRWDRSRHQEEFAASPHAAYPQLRRLKNERVRANLAAGAAPRALQHEVWDEIAAKTERHGVDSPTNAMSDVFDRHRGLLSQVGTDVSMKCSQVGMLAAIGGRFVVLDYVSDVETLAALHGPLVQGYALDALEVGEPAPSPPSLDDAREFLELLLAAAPMRTPSAGLGEGLSFQFGGLAGTGLVVDDQAVTVTAFTR